MVAPAGAGPWPQITSTLSLPWRTSKTSTGTSPPGPLRCGSTTCSVNAVATAASKALPPLSSVAMPTAVAIQWVEATAPKVPSISGRVVNGLGLMCFMGPGRVGVPLSHSSTARPTAFARAAAVRLRDSALLDRVEIGDDRAHVVGTELEFRHVGVA